ncbi:hypothetical protein SDC9_196260 [bioreactor metagenome]|uniref:Uncharacterized protein n=1 Tax=bioreactor metagenome TaxID=1076179 RepID=A0A645IDV8_9ZZZZ
MTLIIHHIYIISNFAKYTTNYIKLTVTQTSNLNNHIIKLKVKTPYNKNLFIIFNFLYYFEKWIYESTQHNPFQYIPSNIFNNILNER